MKRTFFALLAVIIISVGTLVSCAPKSENNGESNAPPTSVKLSKVSLNIMIGETYQLESAVFPETEADMPITWESTNPGVATCDGGLVTALSAGTTIIKAKTETSPYATCTVTVKNKPLSQEEMAALVKFELPALPLWVNYTDPDSGKSSVIKITDKKILFEETTDPKTGTGIIKVALKFVSEKIYDSDFIQGKNPSYLKIKLTTPEKPDKDNDGIFEFLFDGEDALRVNEGTEASGSMNIKSDEIGILFGVSDYKTGRNFKVEILGANEGDVTDYDPSPTSVTLSNSSISLYEGEEFTLTANVTPEGGHVSWKSSDESVAVCDGGRITALSAGSAIITASYGNVSADCVVVVKERASELILSDKSLYLTKGDSYTITFTTSASGEEVIWESSDESVVTCDGGVVVAISEGSAFVTARVGGISAECFIVVAEKIEELEITLSHKNLYIEKGESFTVTAAATIPDAEIIWESLDESVLTCVDGRIYGAEMGNTMIVARSGNAMAYCNVTVIDPARMVTVTVPDFPISLDYIDPKTGKKTSFTVSGCEIEHALDHREGDGNYVLVTVTFKVKKTYDSDGESGINDIIFNVSLEEPGIGHLETELVGETKAAVGSEYNLKYVFGAKFYEGRRNFTISVIPFDSAK